MVAIKAVLKDRFKVLEAKDGEQGLEMVFDRRPDLVLLDISLPGIDGYTVVGKIKEDPAIRSIPVIALTAHAMKGDRKKIIAAGCDDYLSKPIDPVIIMEKIEKFASRRIGETGKRENGKTENLENGKC